MDFELRNLRLRVELELLGAVWGPGFKLYRGCIQGMQRERIWVSEDLARGSLP